MADELMDILAYITKMLEAIVQKVDIEAYSQTLLKELQEQAKLLHGISENSKVTITSIKTSGKDMEDVLRSHGIGLTKEFIANNRMLTDALVQQHKSSPLTYAQLYAARANFASSNISSSQKAEARGEKGTLKNVLDNQSIKAISEEISKKLGLEPALDNTMRKLMMFLGVQNKDNQKKQKNLMDDLVDALGKGRLGKIGQDIFRIVGFMGARWLSQFGQFGKIMGGLFYVAMESFAPILAELLVKGIGKLITGLLLPGLKGTILGLGKLLVGLSADMGGPLGILKAGRFGMMTKTAQIASVRSLVGGLGMAAAATGGAIWAGKEATNSWKEGRKGNAAAFGVGGLALGAGAIAALVAGPLAGITLTLVGIGAAISGIAWLWKKFHKRNQDKDEKDKEEKSWWQNFIDWIKDHWPFGGGGSEDDPTSDKHPVRTFFGGQDKDKVASVGKLELNKQGAMLNIGSMDKMQASASVQEYMAKNPGQFENVYELAGSKYASLGSFQNDLAIRNKQGAATQAVLYKGASKNLEDFWSALVAGGMSKERAELLKYTSGRATKSSGHTKSGSWTSHDNILGFVTDMAEGNKWTDKEWEIAFNTLKPIARQQGFELKYEGNDSKGNRIFGDKFVAGLSNRHFHVQPLTGKNAPDMSGANLNESNYLKEQKTNLEKQEGKVVATRHSISAEEALKKLDSTEYERVKKGLDSTAKIRGRMSDAERDSYYEDSLKAKGYIWDEKSQDYVHKTKGGIRQLSSADPTGSVSFDKTQLAMQSIANHGTQYS